MQQANLPAYLHIKATFSDPQKTSQRNFVIFCRSVYQNAKVQAKTSFAVCCRGSYISW